MTIELTAFSQSIADTIARVAPSIVRVEARGQQASSGVVFTDDGLVLTANHSVERDEAITVHTHDGRALEARLVGRDPSTDLAVLAVDRAAGLAPIAHADTGSIRVGQLAFNVARPGKTTRATSGIVSAFGESYRTSHHGKIDHYLESDAALRPGFSGGALIDADGRLLGIVTGAIVRGTTVAIPVVTAERVLRALTREGGVRRGFLGVGSYPVRLSAAVAARVGRAEGAVIVAIEPDGPAERAGLVQGDVLLAIDETPTAHPAQVAAALEDKADSDVRVDFVRGGEAKSVTVKAGRRR
jgi:serine protease DegQ